MFNLILIYLILLLGSIFLSLLFNKKIGKTFVVYIMSIIFILYFFGLFKILKYGVYFIEIISIIFLIFNIVMFFKIRKKFKELIFTKELIIFTFFYVFLIFLHRGRLLNVWDEFSHWGDVVKAMFDLNDFSTNPNSMSTFKSYPPAISLFQYFFMRVANYFNEYYLYLAYQLTTISLFLPFLDKVKGKKNIIMSLIIIFLLPIIFYDNYYISIYVDSLVGLFFGYITYNLLYNLETDKFLVLNLGLTAFTLVLLKDVGLFLVVLAIMFYLVKLIFTKKNKLKEKVSFKDKFINFKKSLIKLKKIYNYINLDVIKKIILNYKVLNILVIVFMIVLAKVTWNYNIISNNADISFESKFNLSDVIGLFTGNTLPYRFEVITNFITALYDKNFIFGVVNLNYIYLVSIFCLIAVYLNKDKIMIKSDFLLILIGLFFYTIGLLIIYCFYFSEYEAVKVAAFERYLGIYFIGFFYIIGLIILTSNKKIHVFLLVLLFFIPYKSLNNLSVKTSINSRSEYNIYTNYITNKTGADDKIYVIIQNSGGYEYWVMRYSLRPNEINPPSAWSLGKPYFEGDIWTKNFEPKVWMDILINNKYDYVYLFKVDEPFINRYGILFDKVDNIKNNSLFKVNYDTRLLEVIN